VGVSLFAVEVFFVADAFFVAGAFLAVAMFLPENIFYYGSYRDWLNLAWIARM
jgi:hypothetical protein